MVRQAFEVAISSCIIRKWPNTLSYAMDIDHSRPHRPNPLRAQPISDQFALFYRVLDRVKDTILGIQEALASVETSARILQGDSIQLLSSLDSDSIAFVLTSPPYLNAIDYPRAHKFPQWWLSPQEAPLGRSDYIGLRQSKVDESAEKLSYENTALSELFFPFSKGANLQKHLDLCGRFIGSNRAIISNRCCKFEGRFCSGQQCDRRRGLPCVNNHRGTT